MKNEGLGTAVKVSPMKALALALSAESVNAQFRNAMKENSGPFIASIIDLVGTDTALQDCDPNLIIKECLKAATLKLLINKSLGHAYIIPYKIKGVPTPQFQMGYKGFIQLAMRTGQYKFINADAVYEGEEVIKNRVTGQVKIEGSAASEKVIGYLAYFELLNGFSKTVYMTKAEVEAHAKRYSKAYAYDSSPWKTDFNIMAIKTVIKQLLSRYGVLSTEMREAIDKEAEDSMDREIADNANKTMLELGAVPDATTVIKPVVDEYGVIIETLLVTEDKQPPLREW